MKRWLPLSFTAGGESPTFFAIPQRVFLVVTVSSSSATASLTEEIVSNKLWNQASEGNM